MTFLVATTSLPAVYRPNDDRWNVARSCQCGQTKKKGLKNAIFFLLFRLLFSQKECLFNKR